MDRHVRATAHALAAVHRPWAVEVRCLDLAEEVGELARAVLVTEGHKSTAAPAEEVAEALCGVLVDVFALADHYHVELDELYPCMLARFVDGHRGGLGGAGYDPEVPAMTRRLGGRKDRDDPFGCRAAPGVRLRVLWPRRPGNH